MFFPSRRLFMCGLLLLIPVAQAVEPAMQQTPAAAGAAREAVKQSASHDPMAMSSLWQLTFGMLVVLGLILAIAWLLKRSGRFQVAAGGGLRILGGLSMGARERVVLMQVGETQLLLGVAPGRVQTLHVLPQPLAVNQPSNPLSGGFADQLGRMLKKGHP